MDSVAPFLPIVVLILAAGALLVVPTLRRKASTRRLAKRLDPGVARVIATVDASSSLAMADLFAVMAKLDTGVAHVITIEPTGTTMKQVPEMRLVLDVEHAGEAPWRVTITQPVDPGSMPRAGDRVNVLIDTAQPERVQLMPPPKVEIMGDSAALSPDAIRDLMSLTAHVRGNGTMTMAKGTVVSLSPTATSASQITVDIEATGGVPRRQPTITQIIDGPPPAIGELVYVLINPNNPNMCTLMPASLRKMVEVN